MQEGPSDVYRKLARRLSHVDKRERDRGVEMVRGFLEKGSGLSDDDLMKVWKGLYYCMWMSDKAPIQEELAQSLANMVHLGSWKEGVAFVRAFYATMCREWRGIDRLRLDKFYNLMRCVVQEAMAMLSKAHWKAQAVHAFLSMMEEKALDPSLAQVTGVTLHLVDYWIRDLAEADCKVATRMLDPMIHLLGHCQNKLVLDRVREKVFHPLVEDDSIALKVDLEAVASKCFTIGARVETGQRNRKALYAVSARLRGEGASIAQPVLPHSFVKEIPRHEKIQKRKKQKVAMATSMDTVIPHVPQVPVRIDDGGGDADAERKNNSENVAAKSGRSKKDEAAAKLKKKKKQLKQLKKRALEQSAGLSAAAAAAAIPAVVSESTAAAARGTDVSSEKRGSKIRFAEQLERPASPNRQFQNAKKKSLKKRKTLSHSLSEESLAIRHPNIAKTVEADTMVTPKFVQAVKAPSSAQKKVQFDLQSNKTVQYQKGSIVSRKRRHSTGEM